MAWCNLLRLDEIARVTELVVMGDRMTSLPWWSWVVLAVVAVVLWLVLRHYQKRLKAGDPVPKSLTAGRPQL